MTIDWTRLARRIDSEPSDAKLGVSVRAADGSAWSHNGDWVFPSASTVKIPIMIAIYQMIDAGEASLEQRYVLSDADKAAGSGVLQHICGGLQLHVSDLLYLMTAISDNTATNRLIDMAGMSRINAIMQQLGMSRSVLARYMLGRLALPTEQENLATPNDYARVVQSIVRHEAASAESCEAMLALLALQQNTRRIGRNVPRDKRYRWGSKNGTNSGLTHDVGFVSAPSGTMIASIFVSGIDHEIAGEQIIAEVALAAMRVTLNEVI